MIEESCVGCLHFDICDVKLDYRIAKLENNEIKCTYIIDTGEYRRDMLELDEHRRHNAENKKVQNKEIDDETCRECLHYHICDVIYDYKLAKLEDSTAKCNYRIDAEMYHRDMLELKEYRHKSESQEVQKEDKKMGIKKSDCDKCIHKGICKLEDELESTYDDIIANMATFDNKYIDINISCKKMKTENPFNTYIREPINVRSGTELQINRTISDPNPCDVKGCSDSARMSCCGCDEAIEWERRNKNNG